VKKAKVVTPHFTVTGEMYELVLADLLCHAPRVAEGLSFELFAQRERWIFSPDPNNPDLEFYKAQQKLLAGPPFDLEIIVMYWASPDVRVPGQTLWHNHPWRPVRSHVLRGGYRQDTAVAKKQFNVFKTRQFEPQDLVISSACEVKVGTPNTMSDKLLHEVREVDPGTLSLLYCHKGRKGAWGYLNADTLRYQHFQAHTVDKTFMELLRNRNPHLR
jgi:hypothetical protein